MKSVIVLLFLLSVVSAEEVLLFNTFTRLPDGRPQVTCKGEYCYLQPREFTCLKISFESPYRCSTRFYELYGGGSPRVISDIFQDIKISCVEEDHCSIEYYLDGASPQMVLYQQYKAQNPHVGERFGVMDALIYSGILPFFLLFLLCLGVIAAIRQIKKFKTR